MTEALNMQLETVRTVVQNEVNEISVCVDLKRRSGVFYTVIAIASPPIRKQLAAMIADGLFAENRDFIGSFMHGDSLSIVFLYRNEELLTRLEPIYAVGFPARRQIAESMLTALVETQLTGPIGMLLLDDSNINISPNRTINFNYFLDFAKFQPEADPELFHRQAAQRIFALLSAEYEARFASEDAYPIELQAFGRKIQHGQFRSTGEIFRHLKALPDKLSDPLTGAHQAAGRAKGFLGWIRAHASALFLALLVLITLVYAGYQIAVRVSYSDAVERNVTYGGVKQIGTVNLGDDF